MTAVYSPASVDLTAQWLQQGANFLEQLGEGEENAAPFALERRRR